MRDGLRAVDALVYACVVSYVIWRVSEMVYLGGNDLWWVYPLGVGMVSGFSFRSPSFYSRGLTCISSLVALSLLLGLTADTTGHVAGTVLLYVISAVAVTFPHFWKVYRKRHQWR